MSDTKLKTLLTDLQSFIGGACRQGCTHWGCGLRRRIDAALVVPASDCSSCEPTGECENCFGKRVLRERDQARVEAENLKALLDRQSEILAEMNTPAEDRVSALEMEGAVARTEVERLRKALEEALDLAEEGWSYADDLYKTKWKYAQRLAALRPPKEGP